MGTITEHELNATLVDVRKAYRLLYAYQRRVMDTVKFIADTISKNVHSGWAVYSDNSPKNGGKVNLDCWAWDWLNMYMYEFFFGEHKIGEDTINFAIMIQSDTGAYDSNNVVSKTDVELFAPVETSETRVIFQLAKNRWKPDGYHDSEYFSSKSSPILKEVDNHNKFFIAKSYPLSHLMDEDKILDTLRDFAKFCNEMNVDNYFGDSVLVKN